jgi:hypothetical protein
MGCRSRDSCRKLFFNFEILPLPSQYIHSLLLFMIRNKNQFLVNSELHNIDTRQHANFHQPSVSVTIYQKGVYYLGVNVFNMLRSYIKTEFDNPKKFKVVLQNFLYENSFYSLNEYFELQKGYIFTYNLDKRMKDLVWMFLFLIHLSVSFICL